SPHRTALARISRHSGILESPSPRQGHPHRGRSRALPRRVKVVFDTNILVSAIVFPGGRGEAALRRIIEERNELILSKPILDELLGILPARAQRTAHGGIAFSAASTWGPR